MGIIFKNLLKIRKCNFKSIRHKSSATKPPWSVLFFGTDEFSIYSLKNLYSEYKKGIILRKLEVVTTRKGKPNPVKRYADKHNLYTHSWPTQIPENVFDLGLVVSFGHLIPESIIKQFHFGMLNVHASLLPRWRGAAPIIYTLANGDKETGVTIMRVKPRHFDIGEIILQDKIQISHDTRLPELYETLGNLGARCLVQTLQNLPQALCNAKSQPRDGITFAPKVTPEFAVVRWENMSSSQICNLDRAIDGLFHLTSTWNGVPVKLLDITDCTTTELNDDALLKPGFVRYDRVCEQLKVMCANRTWISVGKVGVFGKKIVSARDFNNGYLKKELVENRYFR